MFRAVIVAAVSTPEQAAADRESLPEQLRDCREACERHGWRITREIVIPGHSREYWSLAELCADCPEYQELVDLVEAESVNLVVCMRLARLCRTVPLLTQLTDLCARHQAQIYAVREPQEPLPPDKVRRRRGVAGVLSSSRRRSRRRSSRSASRGCTRGWCGESKRGSRRNRASASTATARPRSPVTCPRWTTAKRTGCAGSMSDACAGGVASGSPTA